MAVSLQSRDQLALPLKPPLAFAQTLLGLFKVKKSGSDMRAPCVLTTERGRLFQPLDRRVRRRREPEPGTSKKYADGSEPAM